MAVCGMCRDDMLEATTCLGEPIEIEGRTYDPIRFGSEERRGPRALRPPDRCHDCGVVTGTFHHPGCDVEECPACHWQLLSCDCFLDDDDEVAIAGA